MAVPVHASCCRRPAACHAKHELHMHSAAAFSVRDSGAVLLRFCLLDIQLFSTALAPSF